MNHTTKGIVNIEWWIEDGQPILHNGMICWPNSIAMIKKNEYRLILTSPGYNDNAQFEVFVDLKDIEPVFA